MASSRLFPQKRGSALNPLHTRGRSGESKILHFKSSLRWMHGMPAGFPEGIPGIGDDIDITIQQAAQFALHSITN
jgi:hypothetical protein